MIVATHHFDKSVMNTVLQDNINPIEKLERSTLIMGSTIQRVPVSELVLESQLERLGHLSPKLLLDS